MSHLAKFDVYHLVNDRKNRAMKGMILVLCGICIGNVLYGQSATIHGKIVDVLNKEPLPLANVFINNSTINATSDAEGNFDLKNVPIGTYELIVHYPGFKIVSLALNVTDGVIDAGIISLNLLEADLSQREQVGSKEASWQNHYKDFKKIFLGNDDVLKQSEILNPYVLNFSKESGILRAKASEAIEISNLYLGYKISFYLLNYMSSRDGAVVEGYTEFEEISTKGGVTALSWMRNRSSEYSGSLQHFIKSVISDQIGNEEFYVYQVENNKSVTSKNFFDRLGSDIIPYDTASLVQRANEGNNFQIKLAGEVEVHHRGSLAKSRQYNDVPYAISRIRTKNSFVNVNQDGSVVNLNELLVTGDMERVKLLKQLPINFSVEEVVTVKLEPKDIRADRVQEKVYIHFDKPYYYPGEMMWMKVSINYRYPQLRDSMSRTLYVELINPERSIVKTHLLRIDSGFAKGNFVIPDTLSHGTYYVRSYTNLNRNFDSQDIFVKPIPILAMTEKVQVDGGVDFIDETNLVSIKSNKETYRTREEITLNFAVNDNKGVPVKSFLSVSVTDAGQVVPVRDVMTIEKEFLFLDPAPTFMFDELKFSVEYGINFRGQFVDERGKPEKAAVSVLQGDFENLSIIETESDGTFQVNGLTFYDSTDFHFQAKDAKSKPYGRVNLIPREPLPVNDNLPEYQLPIVNTETPQRLISEYEVARGARLLQEIVIRGRRGEGKVVRPYGTPDYVINTEDLDISSNNLMLILQGKVPGLVVRTVSTSNGVHKMVRIVRASGLTILGPTEPLVMINDAPMSGIAGDILESINVYTIKSIEIITRVNPTFGSQGANGVIMIYTKEGISPDYVPPVKPMQIIKLGGYATPDVFRYPNYINAKIDRTQIDYRSIIYWNPEVRTSEAGTASVTLYAADLQTRYRVVVEGVTENNEPVRGVYFITVDNND